VEYKYSLNQEVKAVGDFWRGTTELLELQPRAEHKSLVSYFSSLVLRI